MRILVLGGGGREHAIVWALATLGALDPKSSSRPATAAPPPSRPTSRARHRGRRERWPTSRLRTASTSSSSGPRGRWWPASPTRCTRATSRCSDRARSRRGSRAARRSRRASCAATHPDRRFARLPADGVTRRSTYVESRAVPDRGQGRRPRGGQGRDRRDRLARGAERAVEECFDGRFGEAGETRRHRGVPVEGRSARSSRSSTARPSCRWCPRRTTSARSTATPGPNTGGMGVYSPVPGVRRRRRTRDGRHPGADRRGAARGGPRLPRRPLRRVHPHRATARRCSSTTRASATRRPRCSCRGSTPTSLDVHARGRGRRRSRARSSSGRDDVAVCVVLASGGYPGDYEKGKPISGIADAESVAGRHGLPRRHGAARRRHARHRRRPRARRHRGRAHASRKHASARTRRAGKISFDGMFYRSDIASRALDAQPDTAEC